MKRFLAITCLAFILLGAFMLSATTAGIVSIAFDKPHLFVGVTCALMILSLTLPSSAHGQLRVEFIEGICEKVQDSLLNILKSKAPEIKRTQLGYLEALMSPQNTAGVTKVPIDPGNGKKKFVRITFIQRGVEDDVVEDTDAEDCDAEMEKEPFEDTVEVTKFIRTKWMGFTEDEMRKLCEPDSMYMERQVRSQIDALCKKLNKRLIALQALSFGNFLGGTTGPKAVPLLEGVKKSPLYYGESLLMEHFEDLDIQGRPIVVGADNLSHYARQIGIGCCNADGIDLSKAGDLDFFRDRFVGSILGDNHFIGLVPGYVQLLTWNKYVGTYRKENDVFSHTTILDPVTGLTFDMKWKYDDCAEKFVMRLALHYELFFIPDNSFASTDELEGFNGSLHFRADADESCYC